jgi:hypothetical protein
MRRTRCCGLLWNGETRSGATNRPSAGAVKNTYRYVVTSRFSGLESPRHNGRASPRSPNGRLTDYIKLAGIRRDQAGFKNAKTRTRKEYAGNSVPVGSRGAVGAGACDQGFGHSIADPLNQSGRRRWPEVLRLSASIGSRLARYCYAPRRGNGLEVGAICERECCIAVPLRLRAVFGSFAQRRRFCVQATSCG